MELILSIISENFWQIFIIIALLLKRKYWAWAIFLLLSQLVIGYKCYLYAIVIGCILIADWLNPTIINSYKNKIKELENQLKDPDYK